MHIEQLYTGCLSQGAYYVSSNGEAVVIDPLRESKPYIEMAQERGDQIKYVFETHFHADFVSGHLDLSQKTGAPVVFGPGAKTGFECVNAVDGQEFKVGQVTIVALHTPGHTLESTCYLIKDEAGTPKAVFTGDTLFIGDVGRPDLAQASSSLTQEDLAGMLYDSIQTKLMVLPDEVVVYPAHGAGSSCGKNMSKETFDTLGNQKKTNYALLCETKEQFVQEVTCGILPPPQYFPMNVQMNQGGYESLDEVMQTGMNPLSPEAFAVAAEADGAVVLDTRHQQTFKDAFIPGSLFVGLGGQFAPWVGNVISDVKTPILFVCDAGKEQEVITRLSRVGFDNTIGYLDGGIESWQQAGKATDSIESISADELALRLKEDSSLEVFDVRKQSEVENGMIENAHFTSLQFLDNHLSEFHKDQANYVHCAGGYRSMIAASILKAKGFDAVIDVAGGFGAIKKTDVTIVENHVNS